MFEKDMRVAELIDIYGALLSDRRREIIEAYYFDDLSLSEIADNTGISRQGVRDSIKKSENELRSYEFNLHLNKRLHDLNAKINQIADELEKHISSLPPEDREIEILKQFTSEMRSINI